MDKPDTRIIEKIKKLLAFAGDTRGNPNEIARAAAQAEAMLRKYNLEMTDVIMAELKDDADAVTSSDVFLRYRKNKRYRSIPTWAQWIAVAASELFDCHVNIRAMPNSNGHYEASLTFYGYHTDLTIVVWIFDYLCNETYRAARGSGLAGVRAAESYRNGCGSTIANRLRDLKRQRDAENQKHSSSTALVLYKRQRVEDKFGDFRYRDQKKVSLGDIGAYLAGVEAGKKVNINPATPIESTVTDAPRLSQSA